MTVQKTDKDPLGDNGWYFVNVVCLNWIIYLVIESYISYCIAQTMT